MTTLDNDDAENAKQNKGCVQKPAPVLHSLSLHLLIFTWPPALVMVFGSAVVVAGVVVLSSVVVATVVVAAVFAATQSKQRVWAKKHCGPESCLIAKITPLAATTSTSSDTVALTKGKQL